MSEAQFQQITLTAEGGPITLTCPNPLTLRDIERLETAVRKLLIVEEDETDE